MKTNWLYKVAKYLKKIYFRNDRRVVAYLICVAISTGFWFLNALNKTYTEDIVVPVNYINFPNNKTLASKPDGQFDLKVRAQGFTILRNKLSFLFTPIEFNVNELTRNRMQESKKSSFAFPARQFFGDFAYQFSNELEIVSMSPDTLFFKFDIMGNKRVKVQPVLNLSLKKQFLVSGEVETQPDSISVNGAQSTLDTLHCVYTENLQFNDAAKPITEQAKIRPVNGLYYERQSVKVTIPIEEYTEAQQLVPVHLKDQIPGLNVKLFPAKVKISFQAGLSRFSQIHTEDFKLTVSYADIKEGKQRLKITAETTPTFIYSLKITPEELEYLIEK